MAGIPASQCVITTRTFAGLCVILYHPRQQPYTCSANPARECARAGSNQAGEPGVIHFIVRWLIIVASVWVAAWIVPGISIEDDRGVSAILIMAAVLAIVNLLVKPVLTALSCCLIVITLGLFLLVINTLTFWLASGIASDWFSAGFHVTDFWSAFFGGIIVSVVSWLMTAFIDDSWVR